ncbi:MAG: SDR family oxidoreductase [Thermoleophilia bacterium]|nr:SDR family oxidoreductase [Thermoleophilia bacterium]
MSDPTSALRLDGRTVVVTGASRGIGAAVVSMISALGGGVVLVARSRDVIEKMADDLPTPAAAVTGDVADPGVAERAAAAGEDLGGLWGLVNNAGVNIAYEPATAMSLEQWDETLRVNLLGAVSFAKTIGDRLVAAGGGGRIVNVSSIAGLTGLPNIAPYNATKASLDALTRTMAVELGPAGVLCNSVAPGTIMTEMVQELMEANPVLEERLVAKSPLGRIGATPEAAWPIVFLLTDAASFITGEVMVVDGGRLAAG